MTDRKKGFIQLILIIAFVVGAFAISNMLKIDYETDEQAEIAEKILSVEAEIITPRNHQIQFEETGIIAPQTNIDIVPEVSGEVIAVSPNFYEGGLFNDNEILFQIDPTDYQNEVERLKAQVATAQTSLDLATVESDASIREWRSLNGRKKAIPDLVSKTPQLNEAKAALKAAEAQLKTALLNLERTSYQLPFSGRIISSDIAIGRYVGVGQTLGTLYSLNDLEIRTSLDQQRLNWLNNGQTGNIKIKLDNDGDDVFYQGYLKRGSAQLDSLTRLASLSIGIKGDTKSLLPGYFANLEIYGPLNPNTAIIPISAYQTDENIWLIDSDNRIYAHKPEILYQTNDYIAVTNLDGPNNVITSKINGAVEGMRVQILDDTNKNSDQDQDTQINDEDNDTSS